MTEQGLGNVQIEGLFTPPRRVNPLLQVQPEGLLDVKSLLAQKGFAPDTCHVSYSIGSKKITLTIKEKNNEK